MTTLLDQFLWKAKSDLEISFTPLAHLHLHISSPSGTFLPPRGLDFTDKDVESSL